MQKLLINLIWLILVIGNNTFSQNRTQNSKNRLNPYDVSILYPLEKEGSLSGSCNLPTLKLKTKEGIPLLPKNYFHKIVDEAFGIEGFINPPNYIFKRNDLLSPNQLIKKKTFLSKVKLRKSRAVRKLQLKNIQKQFETEYPKPLYCGKFRDYSRLSKLSDEIILDSNGGLSKLKNIPSSLCNYNHWKVTAIRLDLCLEQPEIKNFFSKGESLPKDCLTQELKLTLKPVYSKNEQYITMDNASIKLIFYLDRDQDKKIIKDLIFISQLTNLIEKQYFASNLEIENEPGILMPHPGLRKEMNSCDGSISNSFKLFLSRHIKSKNLVAASYWLGNKKLNRFSMGVIPFYQSKSTYLDERNRVESFSLQNLSRRIDKKPHSENIDRFSENIMDSYLKPFRNSPFKIEEPITLNTIKKIMGKINKIENPTKVTQFPINPSHTGSNCLSCHLTAQSKNYLNQIVKTQHSAKSNFHIYKNQEGSTPKIWSKFKPKSMKQLDNFGYYYNQRTKNLEYSISRRVINETENLLDVIGTYYIEEEED